MTNRLLATLVAANLEEEVRKTARDVDVRVGVEVRAVVSGRCSEVEVSRIVARARERYPSIPIHLNLEVKV